MTGPSPVRIMVAFILYATTVAGLYQRLPEIQKALGLSEAVYGLVLIGMPLGVLFASLQTPRLIAHFGTRRLLMVTLPVGAALQIGAAFAWGAASLAIALFAFGLVFGSINVLCNVEANRFESRTGQRIISRSHGWWALGFLVASTIAAGMIRLDVPPMLQFIGHAALIALAVPLLIGPMIESGADADDGRPRRFALPGRHVLLVGAFALAGLLMEGTTRSWVVIYARDELGAADWVAALALPAVVLTQMLGRFAGDHAASLWGEVQVARASAVVLFVGTALFTLAWSMPVLILSCLMIGAGFSLVQPFSFAASARAPDRPASESVAAFATLSVLLGFVGPPLFGGLAEWIGLRAAFALVLPLPFLSWWLAGILRRD